MKTYDINVTRDGRWWMIEIPALDGLTQTRRLAEAEQMAREYIAVTTDVPISEVTIRRRHLYVGDADIAEVREKVDKAREAMKRAERKYNDLMKDTATRLADEKVPVRDIEVVLGVSHQRIGQLVKH